MIAFFLSSAGRWTLGIAFGAALLFHTHMTAYQSGRNAERSAAIQRSIDLIRDRSDTNEAIRRMPDGDLCRELGGEWDVSEDRCN